MYTINMCINTCYSSRICPFNVFSQSKEEKTHKKKKEWKTWERGKISITNKLNFAGTQYLSAFFWIFLEVPSFQRPPVFPQWWLPDVSVPAEHLPALFILGNADLMGLHFWLSVSFKELANSLHVHWFYCLNGFPILMMNLFLSERLNF